MCFILHIPAAPAYGVNISELIHYPRVEFPIMLSLIESCCSQESYQN